MKLKSFYSLIITACLLVLMGCSEQPTMPDMFNDNTDNTLQKGKTTFTGTSVFIGQYALGEMKPLPNEKMLWMGNAVEWYDEADDWRVTGKSMWYVNRKIEGDVVKVWGKAQIFVDGENPGDEPRGLWDISWHGWMADGQVVAEAVGQGKEGVVKGLVAKWVYTMDLSGGLPPIAYYESEGYIVDK